MGEQNKLTAELMLKIIIDDFYKDVPKGMRTDFQMLSDDPKRIIAAEAMRKYAAQETAALREELQGERVLAGVLNNATKDLEKELEAVKRKHWKEGGITLIESVVYEKTLSELEAVKKERDKWKQSAADWINLRAPELSEVTRHRDEALDIASELLSQLKYVQEKFIQTGSTPGVITQCETRLSRLSSGETKPVNNFCPHCSSPDTTPYGTILQWYCKNCGEQFGESLTDKSKV